MKYLLTFLSIFLFSSGIYADTTFVSGTIVSETWTPAGSPYAVEGDILIASLTIEPGVMVIFLGDYVFEIAGVILAVGTAQDSIKFKRATSNEVGWQGLFFNFSVPGSELAYCRIEGATNSGIYIDNSLPTISNCTIINNSVSGNVSEYGGGIYVIGTLTLDNCVIKNNSALVSNSSSAGGFYTLGGGIYVDGTCNLSNCIIEGNTTSTITGNAWNSSYSRGGGIYVNGEFNLTNCIISENISTGNSATVEEGGGAYFNASDSSFITNTTIAYNTNEGFRTVGGGSVTVTNSIIYFNTPQANQIGGTPNVNYSDVQGGYTGTENIDSNPVFLSLTELIIVVGSQCVDAGDPNSVYNDVCFPPSLGTERNDMGAHGGPGACGWDSGTPVTTFQLTVSVDADWNMLSVPGLHPTNQNVDTWWSGKDPAAGVFKFAGGYVQVTTTTPTEGYWMKNVGAQVYNYPAIQTVAHDPINASAGWSLIGGYDDTVSTASLTTNPPGLMEGSVFEFSGGYQVATNLVPGYGYWIKLSSAGQIIVPDVLAKGTEPVEYFREDWGKIILTDAAGISYTLYAVTGKVNLNKYELPPAPPAGMFDIRFSSGRIAEDINSSIQTIDMSGVTYPLTVRAEGMDIRLMDETGSTVNVNLKSGEDVVIRDATIQKLMVTGGESLPTVYALEQNYPNPFNPSTTIEFSLPEDVSNVKLSIYNALGERVAEIVNTSLVAGKYQYQWNAKNVATGMYIYELRADKFVSIKKMILLK